MFRPRRHLRLFALLFLIAGSGIAQAEPTEAVGQRVRLAIADFVYVDTSGEQLDQNAAHQRRLKAFMDALRQDFTTSDRFHLIAVPCGPTACNSESTPSADLIRAAVEAGAKMLVIGGVHKQSTLIQWAKVQVFDIDAKQFVFDKLFTFRGDTDEAWRRAEIFVSQDIRAALK